MKKITLILGLLLASCIANAAEFNVNTTADAVDASIGDGVCASSSGACTLRAAVQESNFDASSADVIHVPAGRYELSVTGSLEDSGAAGDLDILGDVTISGAGAADTVIDGNWNERIFHVIPPVGHPDIEVTLSGMTVTEGLAPSNFSGFPRRPESGGGILILGGHVVLDHMIVTENSTSNGFLVFFLPVYPSAGGFGGGIAIESGRLDIRNSTISGNVTGNGTDTPNAFTPSGSSGGLGGGIFISIADVTVRNSLIANNVTGNGGGADFNSSSGLSGGLGGHGGGIYAFSGSLLLENVTFSGNITGNGGPGGAALAATGGAGGNGGNGGALHVTNSEVTINNTTIAGNKTGEGNVGGSSPTSLVGPSGVDGLGGGIYLDDTVGFIGTVTVSNSILALNTALGSPDCFGALISNGYNFLSEDTGCVGFVDDLLNDDVGGVASLIDPGFDLIGLNDNGGPTQTIAIVSASAAKDSGNNATCATTDQRGEPRPLTTSTCDKGAFEITACGDGTVQSGEECDMGGGGMNTCGEGFECDAPTCSCKAIEDVPNVPQDPNPTGGASTGSGGGCSLIR